jgi:hypothetical protein
MEPSWLLAEISTRNLAVLASNQALAELIS